MPFPWPLWAGKGGAGDRIRTGDSLLGRQAPLRLFTPKLPVLCHKSVHLGVVLNESNSLGIRKKGKTLAKKKKTVAKCATFLCNFLPRSERFLGRSVEWGQCA